MQTSSLHRAHALVRPVVGLGLILPVCADGAVGTSRSCRRVDRRGAPTQRGRRGNREWKHYWFPLLNFLGEQYDAKANELPDKFDSCAYCFKPCNLKPCEGVKGGSACPFGTAKGGKWVHHCCMDKYSALADEVGGRRCRNCFSASCLKEVKKLLSSDVTNNEEEEKGQTDQVGNSGEQLLDRLQEG